MNIGIPVRTLDNVNMIIRLLYFKISYFYPLIFLLLANVCEILTLGCKFYLTRGKTKVKYDGVMKMIKVKWIIESVICMTLTLNFFSFTWLDNVQIWLVLLLIIFSLVFVLTQLVIIVGNYLKQRKKTKKFRKEEKTVRKKVAEVRKLAKIRKKTRI